MAVLIGLGFGIAAVCGLLLSAVLVVGLLRVHRTLLPVLLAFAAGTLLGAALLDLLPEAAHELSPARVGSLMLAAVVAFFLLERWVRWWHVHTHEPKRHTGEPSAAGYLILVGDGLHNLVDGLALGTAVAADPTLGVAVGLAVVAHEVPQEVGDFVLLLESGLTRARALILNLLTALVVFPGIVIGYTVATAVEPVIGVALALATGAFLYVALADLIPELHRRGLRESLAMQVAPLLGGIAVIWLAGLVGT
jgi:zinc and cadmium transporter